MEKKETRVFLENVDPKGRMGPPDQKVIPVKEDHSDRKVYKASKVTQEHPGYKVIQAQKGPLDQQDPWDLLGRRE